MAIPTLQVCIRRQTIAAPWEWWVVRGQRFVLKDYGKLKGFTYRDGPLCFAVEESSGVTLGMGTTHPRAILHARRVLEEQGLTKTLSHLKTEARKCKVGPRPTKFSLVKSPTGNINELFTAPTVAPRDAERNEDAGSPPQAG